MQPYQKKTPRQAFAYEISKIFKNTFFKKTSGGYFWNYDYIKLVKSETSGRYATSIQAIPLFNFKKDTYIKQTLTG